MEATKQQLQSTKAMNEFSLNEQSIASNQLIYKNFATKSTQSFLGISIQKERLYVIQKKSISVFQHFIGFQNQISHKGPVLIKEIFLPFEISKYIITERYICIKSKSKTQIRDNEFQKVFYSQNKGIFTSRTKNESQESFNSNNFTFDSVQQLELECEIVNDDMISWKVFIKKKSNNSDPRYLRQYWSEKYNILTNHKSIIKCKAEMIDPTNKNRKLQICKSPVFINQLGYIQNFYIWPVSSNDIQIGIFFNQKQHGHVTENALYQICSFQLNETNIKNIFYYNFKGTNAQNKNQDGPHLFLAVCENSVKEKSKIKIVIFQILPEQKISNDQSQNEALNNCLDQFNQLKKQKKSQQSISNSILLNELLNNEEKSSFCSNPSKPNTILESFTIKNSCSLKKVFYNPTSKVLWINDASDLVYKVKFVESGDIKSMKQNKITFIENLQGFQNGETGPDLQGIMCDNFPIFKVKAFALQIGLRSQALKQYKQAPLSQTNEPSAVENGETKIVDDQKEIIQFNDTQLEKIQHETAQNQLLQTENQQKIKSDPIIVKQLKQIQIQTDEEIIEQKKPEIKKSQLQSQSTQTQTQSISFDTNAKIQKSGQNKIQINNLSQLLKELNFNKVEDVLIRFSTLFSANVTKNVNKLKDSNSKAKEQIKLKINGDIFQLIKEVFSSLMSEGLSQKIEKQMGKSREFVQKIFSKHMQHFNLMILEQRLKEQNVKKHILEQQIQSIEVIKQASLKFLDVTKVREMQKIAYNEIVVESIKGVGQKITDLQNKVDQMLRQSEDTEKKIIEEIKEIKETFKLLIELEENESQEEESKKAAEESSESGFESQEDEEQSQQERDVYERQDFEQRRIPPRPVVQAQQHPYVSPQVHLFNQRPTGWNSAFYQSPVNYSYPSYPLSLPPGNVQPHYPPVYPPFTQPYYPHQNPYESTISSHQQQYFPSPYPVHAPLSEIRTGSQKVEDPIKIQKKKNSKPTRKSSSLRND